MNACLRVTPALVFLGLRPVVAAVALCVSGCVSMVDKPRLSVAANVSEPVPGGGPARMYHFEVLSQQMLALVAPEHERLRAALAKHGYSEVPASHAGLVVEIRLTAGVPVYSDVGAIVPRPGAENMRDEQRVRTLAAVLPNRYQDVFNEEGAMTPYVIGPNGEIIASGDRLNPPTGDLDPEVRPRHFVSVLELHARDASPAAQSEPGRPRWQVVVICEAGDPAALLSVAELIDVAADYVDQTTRGEKAIEVPGSVNGA